MTLSFKCQDDITSQMIFHNDHDIALVKITSMGRALCLIVGYLCEKPSFAIIDICRSNLPLCIQPFDSPHTSFMRWLAIENIGTLLAHIQDFAIYIAGVNLP